MWHTIGAAVLIGWLVVAVGIVVVVAIRRVRAGARPGRWRPGRRTGASRSLGGPVPPTPLPEWVNWDDDGVADDTGSEAPDRPPTP